MNECSNQKCRHFYDFQKNWDRILYEITTLCAFVKYNAIDLEENPFIMRSTFCKGDGTSGKMAAIILYPESAISHYFWSCASQQMLDSEISASLGACKALQPDMDCHMAQHRRVPEI